MEGESARRRAHVPRTRPIKEEKTLKAAFSVLLLAWLTTSALADEHAVGFRSSTLADPHNARPLEMVVWYPSKAITATQLIGDNPVFVGASAMPDAPPAAGKYPLVVLSHGYRGNWSNQIWLASALAHKGYIVAAVNHPGSTPHDRSPQAAAQLWQRPVDLRRAIDGVIAHPERFGAVTDGRIAVVGHSLGGWTALEIAGARFDPERFAQDCDAHPQLSSCTVYAQMKPAGTTEAKAALGADWRDARVTAVVTLDLGLSRGLTDQSLATLPVPALVIAAGVPSRELPAGLESANLAKRLPAASSRYLEISDASHFTFMSMCKPGAQAVLEAEVPGDGIICRDGDNGRARDVIQQQVSSLIAAFLQQSPGATQGSL